MSSAMIPVSLSTWTRRMTTKERKVNDSVIACKNLRHVSLLKVDSGASRNMVKE